MNTKDLLLAIDCGTQSLKALIFDLQGNLFASENVPFKPYFSEKPGWAEQDPDVFWQALCQACQRLWEKRGVDKNRVAGVSLTTQRGTVVNVDKEGNPLRPAILWQDERKTHGLPPIKGYYGWVFRLLGLSKTISYLQEEAEINWIRANQPEVWRKTHKYLLLSGYLTYKLTEEFHDSIGCQVGYIPFDYKRLRWASEKDWKWKALPIDPGLLPALIRPGKTLGIISQKASKETGIPAGLRLVASAADKACEVLGSGALDPSIGCLSYGTTATFNVVHRKYLEIIRPFPAYPSAIPHYYTLETRVPKGYGWMINWFKEQSGYSESQIDKLIDTTSPGLKIANKPSFRSTLEEITYALREGKEQTEKKTKTPIVDIRVSGGVSQSQSAVQMAADIFGLPATRLHTHEASGLGTAIVLAKGLAFYANLETAAKEMVHIKEIFEPRLEIHRIYNRLYRCVYKKRNKKKPV